MSDFTLFLGKFLKHGTAIASIAPSSPWLSRTTIREIPWETSRVVVELGAGTGPITRAIAQVAPSSCQVIVVERDPDFSAILRQRYADRPNFQVLEGDVRDLDTMLERLGITEVDHVVSGLPVPSFPRDLQRDLFVMVKRLLKSEGTYNQITELPWVYQSFYRKFFHEVRFVFEPRNLPPAGAYLCRGVKELD